MIIEFDFAKIEHLFHVGAQQIWRRENMAVPPNNGVQRGITMCSSSSCCGLSPRKESVFLVDGLVARYLVIARPPEAPPATSCHGRASRGFDEAERVRHVGVVRVQCSDHHINRAWISLWEEAANLPKMGGSLAFAAALSLRFSRIFPRYFMEMAACSWSAMNAQL